MGSEPNIHGLAAKLDMIIENVTYMRNTLDDKLEKKADKEHLERLEERIDKNGSYIAKLMIAISSISATIGASIKNLF